MTVAGDAGNASRDMVTGSDEIGREAEILRIEVDQFLMAVCEEPTEQRHYERSSCDGIRSSCRPRTIRNTRRTVDHSRGGALLDCDWPLTAGTTLEVELPAGGGLVTARVADPAEAHCRGVDRRACEPGTHRCCPRHVAREPRQPDAWRAVSDVSR